KSISLIMDDYNVSAESPQTGQGRQNAIKCGWLRKQGGFVKTWHTRWFVLKGDQLYYFKDEDEIKPLGTIFLPGNRVVEHPCNEDSPGKFLFEVVAGLATNQVSLYSAMTTPRVHYSLNCTGNFVEMSPIISVKSLQGRFGKFNFANARDYVGESILKYREMGEKYRVFAKLDTSPCVKVINH
ncbi:rho GTPase-activating 24 isoform X1, partial [Pelobates cultripes]